MSKASSTTGSLSDAVNDIRGSVSSTAKDITERAREAAVNAADSSISFAKKYPVHTALGALGLGCIVGYLSRKPK